MCIYMFALYIMYNYTHILFISQKSSCGIVYIILYYEYILLHSLEMYGRYICIFYIMKVIYNMTYFAQIKCNIAILIILFCIFGAG